MRRYWEVRRRSDGLVVWRGAEPPNHLDPPADVYEVAECFEPPTHPQASPSDDLGGS